MLASLKKMKKVFQKEILVVVCRCVGFPFGVQAGCFSVFSSCCLASAIVSLFREFFALFGNKKIRSVNCGLSMVG